MPDPNSGEFGYKTRTLASSATRTASLDPLVAEVARLRAASLDPKSGDFGYEEGCRTRTLASSATRTDKKIMKVPLSWLRDYVDVTLPVEQLAVRLTLAGLEVAGIRAVGLPVPEGVRVKPEDAGPVWDREKVVVAEVVEVLKHPDADKLKLPVVSFGGSKTKQLLTGAPNIN